MFFTITRRQGLNPGARAEVKVAKLSRDCKNIVNR